MAYLITQFAISLAIVGSLGLLLGWLLWGYIARQRGQEVKILRERMSEMQVMAMHAAVPPAEQPSLPEPPEVVSAEYIEDESDEKALARRAFFEDEGEEFDARPLPSPPPLAPDLEAEVKDARIRHLESQIRDLEGVRDRLHFLQADLSDAIGGRRSAEAKYQEVKNDFEVRSSSLLSRISDLEGAASEWDKKQEQFERERFESQKELSIVQATLRDLQNSQRPAAVNTAIGSTVSEAEFADLRQRYDQAIRERDAIAAELETKKETEGDARWDWSRQAELESALRAKDAQLADQAARVESLLWRVAELEPFSSDSSQKDDLLQRQESEIAGHMAMHAENTDRIRALQKQLSEVRANSVPLEELQAIMEEHQAQVQKISRDHEQRLAEMRETLSQRDQEISEHVSARYGQANAMNGTLARLAELEAQAQRFDSLEKELKDRTSEIQRLVSMHSQAQREAQSWKSRAAELQPLASQVPELQALAARVPDLQALASRVPDLQSLSDRVPDLQNALTSQALELRQLKEAHADKEGQLMFLQERLGVLSNRLAAQQQQLQQLEPLAARASELEKAFTEREQQLTFHQQQLSSYQERLNQLEPLAAKASELEKVATEREQQLTFHQQQLSSYQERLNQLEPLAAKTAELERSNAEREQQWRDNLKSMEERHQADLSRLKANSAQRIRRLRQSITGFKG